jgi:bifunctional DNase/RNase
MRPFRLSIAVWPVVALSAIALGCAKSRESVRDPEDVPVTVVRVAVDENNLPLIVLEERNGPRWLPIWVGTAEAISIAGQIEERVNPRPNTHDLAGRLIQSLRGEVDRVVVTKIENGTYFATLSLRSNGEIIDVDSRPSDAIAIALRSGAPIFVRAALFVSAALEEDEPPPPTPTPERET